MMRRALMRLMLSFYILGRSKAFQSRFDVHHVVKSTVSTTSRKAIYNYHQTSNGRSNQNSRLVRSMSSNEEVEVIHVDSLNLDKEKGVIHVSADVGQDDLPDDILVELDSNQPSELSVLKNLLGINIFTYILAAAIVFFFSMNLILGPGWLGNSIGLEGTGTFQKVSDSLPDTIDLSNSDYLL